MPQHLSDEQRYLIVYLHKKAISERKIASEVGCSKTGVNVTIKRWKETGKFEERPGRGRTEVESSRTHFGVLGLGLEAQVLGLEASSPRKLACPRLEDGTIF